MAQLSFGATSVPDRLKESLIGGTVLLPPAFPVANRATSVRARGLIAIGGGAAGVCVVGVLALGLSGGAGVDPRPPVTDLSRQIAPSATREATPAPRRQPVTPLREKMARWARNTRRPSLTACRTNPSLLQHRQSRLSLLRTSRRNPSPVGNRPSLSLDPVPISSRWETHRISRHPLNTNAPDCRLVRGSASRRWPWCWD